MVVEIRVDEVDVRFVDEQHATEFCGNTRELLGGGQMSGWRMRIDSYNFV